LGRLSERGALALVSLTSFAVFLSANMLKPVLPVLASDLGGGELEVSGVMMAALVLLSLAQPLTGALSDRYGRVRMLVVGGALGALSSLACAAASSWSHLLALRGLSGLADAISGPAMLAIVASVSTESRGLAFGVFRFSQGASFVLGPLVGAAVAELWGLRAPFVVDFALTVAAVVAFAATFRHEAGGKAGSACSLRAARAVLSSPKMLRAACLGFLETSSFAIWLSFLPARMVALGLGEAEVALVISAEALAFSASSVVVGYASDKVGRRPVALLGSLVAGASSALYLAVSDVVHLALASAAYGAGCSAMYLVSTVAAADLAPEEARGAVLGSFDAIVDLGLAAGPLANWALLRATGLPSSASFTVMVLLSALAAVASAGLN